MLVPSIGFESMEIFNETLEFLGAKISGEQPFEQDPPSVNLSTACYICDAAKKSMGPVSVVKMSISRAVGSSVPLATGLLVMVAVAFVLM